MFVLVFMEAIVRLFHLAPKLITNIGYFKMIDNSKIVYEFIPGAVVDGSPINKQGFKDTDFRKEKAHNLIRIAMLGDSITQGLFVESDRIFSNQLERNLNLKAESLKSNFRYEVMNFGVGGYNLEAEVETLKTKVLQYSPDIVLLNFFQNDSEPIPGLYVFFINEDEFDKEQRDIFLSKYLFNHSSPLKKIIKESLYKSRLYLFVISRLSNIRKSIKSNQGKRQDMQSQYWDRGIIYRNLSEIERLKVRYGFKFLICIHTDLAYGDHQNNSRIAEIAQSFSFPYFYMSKYYKQKAMPTKLLQARDEDLVHPNYIGHQIISEAIFIELKRNGFIDSNMY